jgi:CheY-like chemotaxis protein
MTLEVSMPQKLRILFVEDNEDHAQLVLRLLKKEDYDVEWQRVETAEDARSFAA